jgi:hypothetical protein
MISGVALAISEVSVELMDQHRLGRRASLRGGEPEIQFRLRDAERVLPVWLDGQLQIVRWGNRRDQSPGLPCTAWTSLATLAVANGSRIRHLASSERAGSLDEDVAPWMTTLRKAAALLLDL